VIRTKWIVVLGVIAVLGFAIATLPASMLAGRVEKHGVSASSWNGSIWSGSARDLAFRGRSLGTARWSISPWSLLSARLTGHGALSQDDGNVEADFSLSFAGRADLANVNIDLPLDSPAFQRLAPRGWTGRVQGHFDTLGLKDGWPVAALGTVDIVDIVAPPPRGGAMGGYRLSFPDPSAPTDTGEDLEAALTDLDGPLSVNGHLRLANDRSYELEGHVSRKGTASTALDRAIEMLGPPDASGRRPFGLSGTF
jgi:general secretion pathway protein N